MNEQQAVALVQQTFQSAFERGRYLRFLKNLLNEFDEEGARSNQGARIPEKFQNHVQKLERVGKYRAADGEALLFIVWLKNDTSLERARTMQRNFIAHYLQMDLKDAALVAFVSSDPADWRFSFVKMEYRYDAEKNKIREEFTPAKRWSFLVGAHEASHTAQSKLVPLMADDEHNPTLADLEDAFNIEKVTKEFFEKYRGLFIRTKEALDEAVSASPKLRREFESKGIDTVNLAKKLLGQIIFLYYLQKKGWFGVARDAAWGEGSRNFLRELFDKKHGDYQNFFNDVLEPLFYDALRRDRSEDDHYYPAFKCKIPFLNGGLFDPMNNYDWVNTDILLPNELFSSVGVDTPSATRPTWEEDDGILDVFDRYNFTVKEDEPFEREVAIDPELLGKAYEKFNAIRPDNYAEFLKTLKSGKKGDESKFNKQYGVYYTPREIVHYMCQQSLINYLSADVSGNQELGIGNYPSKDDFATLILKGGQIKEHDERVLAEGRETATYSFQMPESIRAHAALIDEKLANIKVCDPAVGSGAFPVGMMSEIVRAREVLRNYLPAKETHGKSIYDFKRECIENSLYGVDIDPGAVEIAKLRLWLSLVVDENDIRNIKPLPNLDYKIVCGNSLIGVEKNLFNNHLFVELEALKPLYFNAANIAQKKEYKAKIDGLIDQITDGRKQFDFEIYFSEVFHEKGGFDVVIGNPPYVSAIEFTNKYGDQLRTLLNNNYKSAKGAYDLYVLFIEKGLLLTNKNGCLVYITPNKYLSANYGIAIREFILNKYSVLQIVDLSPIKVFEEALVYPIISVIQNIVTNEPVRVLLQPNKAIDIFDEMIFTHVNIERSMLKLLPEKLWGFLLSNHIQTLIKLLEGSKELQNYGDVNATSTASEADEYGKYIVENKQSDSKKLINTGTIDKWTSTWGFNELTNAGKKISKPYLKLTKISERRREMYNSPKIIFAKMAKVCEAFLDIDGDYASINTNCFYKPHKGVSIKTIAAICNSKVFMFLYEQLFGALRMSGGYFQFQAPQLRIMPIKYPDSLMENKIVKLVDRILAAKAVNPQADTRPLEEEIDQLVYQLYGLTEEEIRIVEGKA
jgi:hypothetical protein